MTDQVQLACTISSLDPTAAVGLEIWIDDTQIYNTEHVSESVNFTHEFADTDGKHQLRFVMKNKTHDHTKIDEAGNILKDCRICIDKLSFDEIDLQQIFIEQTVYEHNFNGTADTIQDQFFGEMGCNGTLTLEFTTPVYLWLLENM
jgi:hypothetical protein